MKKLFFGLCSLALLTASCQDENLFESNYLGFQNVSIEAHMEGVPSTRATETSGQFAWSIGDKISIWTTWGASSETSAFKVLENTASEAGATATFTGTIPGQNPQFSSYAIYPSGAHALSGTELSINLPAEYGAYGTELSSSVNTPMVASIASAVSASENVNLSFKHVGGVMRFDITNVPENTDEFVFTSAHTITGNFAVTEKDGENVIEASTTETDNNTVSIKFVPSEEKTHRVFYVPLPTGDYSTYSIAFKKQGEPEPIKTYDGTGKTLNRAVIAKVFLTFSGVTGDIQQSSVKVTNNNEAAKALAGTSSTNPVIYLEAGKDVTEWILPEQFTVTGTTASTLHIEYTEKPESITVTAANKDVASAASQGTVEIVVPVSGDVSISNVDISTPTLTTTLTKSGEGTLNYSTAKVKTATSTLIINEGVTVGALTAQGGNIEVGGGVTTLILEEPAKLTVEEGSTVGTVQAKTDKVEVAGGGTITSIADEREDQTTPLYIAQEKGADGSTPTTTITTTLPATANTNITSFAEADLRNAFAKASTDANAPSKHTLTEDINITKSGANLELAEGKYMELDLNGKTLTVDNTETARIVVYGNLTLTVLDYVAGSTIKSAGNGAYGVIEVNGENAKLTSKGKNGSYAINIISEESYGIVVKNNADLYTKNTNMTTKLFAISGNNLMQDKAKEGSVIDIDTRTVLKSTADYAIFLPFNGTTTICKNSKTTIIEGAAGAIAMMEGTLNIKDGPVLRSLGTGDTGDGYGPGTLGLPNAVLSVPASYGDCTVNIDYAVFDAQNGAEEIDFSVKGTISDTHQRNIVIDGGEFKNFGCLDFPRAETTSNRIYINLQENTVIDKPIVFNKGKYTLNLDSYTISNTTPMWYDVTDHAQDIWSLVAVSGTADVKIKADNGGGLKALENDTYACHLDSEDATLTIESGEYVGNISSIYTCYGNLNITGGTFKIQQLSDTYNDYRFLINCKDEYYKADKANVTITGGKFYGFNPSDNAAEGAGTNFCATGYVGQSAGTEGEVTIYEAIKVATEYDRLRAMLTTGGNFVLGSDITSTSALEVPMGTDFTLDLNGHTITANYASNGGGFAAFKVKGTLTVVDSSNDDTGKIIVNHDNFKGTSETEIQQSVFNLNWETSKLTVNGGTFEAPNSNYLVCVDDAKGTATATLNGGRFHAAGANSVYIWEGGKVEINGGSYSAAVTNPGSDYYFTLNINDNYRNVSSFVVKGGEFHNFNPINCNTEGANTNFVAPSYHIEVNGSTTSDAHLISSSTEGTVYTVVED